MKPTTKQRLAFDNLIKALQSGSAFNMENIMLKAGYTKATAHNPDKNLTSKTGWNKLLSKISDEAIISKFEEILNDTDKRSSLSAGIELLKLKDRYPDKKLRVGNIDEMLNDIRD